MIALFDSGIGGLTVLAALWRRFPDRDYLYMSDQAHFPYGDRPVDAVRRDVASFAAIARGEGAEALVLACNTASAIALHSAEAAFGGKVYGVIAEAAEQAARRSGGRVVGVLATSNTCRTHAYRDAVEGPVAEVACPSLIALAEEGGASDAEVEREAQEPLRALRSAEAGVVILGCTHLPHFERVLRRLVEPWSQLLDPGEALAERLSEVLPAQRESGGVRCVTTGDPKAFAHRLAQELPEIARRATISHISLQNVGA